jgi:hypothetical protein
MRSLKSSYDLSSAASSQKLPTVPQSIDAHLMTAIKGVTNLHIWPPATRAVIQIGRFGIPYELNDK